MSRDESDAAIALEPRAIFGGTEPVGAGRLVESAVGIGYKAEPRGAFHLKRKVEEFGREVLAIRDDFGAHFGISEDSGEGER